MWESEDTEDQEVEYENEQGEDVLRLPPAVALAFQMTLISADRIPLGVLRRAHEVLEVYLASYAAEQSIDFAVYANQLQSIGDRNEGPAGA